MTDEIFYYQALNYSIIVIYDYYKSYSNLGVAKAPLKVEKEIFTFETCKGRA